MVLSGRKNDSNISVLLQREVKVSLSIMFTTVFFGYILSVSSFFLSILSQSQRKYQREKEREKIDVKNKAIDLIMSTKIAEPEVCERKKKEPG